MFLTRKRLLVGGIVVCCAASGGFVGATLASGGQTPSVAAFTSNSAPPAPDPANIQNLADDVGNVPPGATNHDGTPLTGQARALITNVGSAHDTLSAFPTSNGDVCFEVLAAGTCGKADNSGPFGAGITPFILSVGGVTRVYGAASDSVARVDIEIGGANSAATLGNNGFYYQLPDGVSSSQIEAVIATWKDGSVHTFPVHG